MGDVSDDPDTRLEYLRLQVQMLLALQAPRERVKQEGALELAYAHLACSSYRRPSRAMFRDIALWRYGWSEAEFEAWATCEFHSEWVP